MFSYTSPSTGSSVVQTIVGGGSQSREDLPVPLINLSLSRASLFDTVPFNSPPVDVGCRRNNRNRMVVKSLWSISEEVLLMRDL